MDFEKLGVFYLGRRTDAEKELVLYDSRDLVTHAVCVGMTGSGKTGLLVGLLEEAALDGIPALVIDPKGDLGNLLLTFPELRAEDFLPWVNEDDARRQGLTPTDFAARQAETWRNGLADWGQDGARIARLRAAAEFSIYTPGNSAGLPISILSSFAAPPPAVRDDADLFRERVATTAASLLGLAGVDADPLQSREHILVATLLDAAWKAGRDLDLAGLIQEIQTPPVTRVGVLELESFFPAKERFGLAMAVNNVLAAPGAKAWLEGPPPDVQSLLFTPAGKPRVAIVSIAHLGDAERMFFVALLLNQVLGWVRSQPGTTSLRAILAMDEVVGFLPPVANPPSKAPLLTLLKQARAFGLGVVVATQNPVDLDYKALANTGTWFVGRLQTERDRARLLDGLEGAAGGKLDRATAERTIAGLQGRQFLLHDVHEDAPVVFGTRWTMSYLRGPLTSVQVKQLMGEPRTAPAGAPAVVAPSPRLASAGETRAAERPVLPPDVPQFFLPPRGAAPAGATLLYQPMLLGAGSVAFRDAKAGVDAERTASRLAPLPVPPAGVRWEDGEAIAVGTDELAREPESSAAFAPLPADAVRARSFDAWRRAFADFLARTETLTLRRSAELGAVSRPDESERDFRARLQHGAREARDAETERLRQRFAPRLAALQERLRRAQQAVARETSQAQQQKVQSAISIGATLLGAVFGRRAASAANIGRATTAVRGVGRAMRESGDVARAGETVQAIEEQLAALEGEFQDETAALATKHDPLAAVLETVELRPKKTGVRAELAALVWAPYWRTPDGALTPAWG